MKNVFIFLLSVILITACREVTFNAEEANQYHYQADPVSLAIDDIKIEGELGSFRSELSERMIEPGVKIITVRISSDQAATPPQFNVKWSLPSSDFYAFWTSVIRTDKVTNWYTVNSRASSQAPVYTYLNVKDENRITVALSDALNKVRISNWLREEDIRVYTEIGFFEEPYPEIHEYEVQIRIDTRNIHYSKALSEVSNWWAGFENYKPAYVPDDARKPLYSTWYSFHQQLDVVEVIEQCRLGKEIGLEAVIVDDGWQTFDNKRGYRFTGDWLPERIPEMKAFVDSVHALDMKFMLWYSLPFIGEKAESYPDFKGKYLHYWDSQGAYILDPRYPQVREHIIGTYEKAMDNWGLDGFKLDFLGWFYADDETVLTAENGRDYASVNDAVDRLMTDIMHRLRAKNPNILIEFRQPYIGPLMRKYGNMFRAADCPNMAVVNRVRTTDLRLLSGNTAVHSDMFRWHPDEPVESAALQILNIIYTVPQFSLKIDSIPQDHINMSAFWMKYWTQNKEILLDGDFKPASPGALYPIISSTLEDHQITTFYNDEVLKVNTFLESLHLINAKATYDLYVDFQSPVTDAIVSIYNCTGQKIGEFPVNELKGLQKFNCPPSGLITINR